MNYKKHVINSAKMLLLFMTGVVGITAIGFFLGIIVNITYFIVPAFLLICIGCYFSADKGSYFIDLMICSLIVLVCILISVNVYDISWDGECYHKYAVGLLKEGWNPVYMKSNDFCIASSSLRYSNGGFGGIWEESYPKATWYFAAVIYDMTGNIEAGKCYTLLFTYITFGICLEFFQKKLSGRQAVLISMFITFNPIVCAQFQSYYLDGVVACVLSSLIILLIGFIDNEDGKISLLQYLLVFSLILWGCNLKFSVNVFIITFCFTFCIISSLKRKKIDKQNFVILLMDGIIAIFIFGFAPYITNIIRHGSMFYSFAGMFNEESMQAEFGIGINGRGRFLVSLFSKMSQGGYSALKDFLKIPFTFSGDEIFYYSAVDARTGGFGIFFSGLLIVAFLVICTVLKKRKKTRNISWRFCFTVLLMTISIVEFLVLPQTSQARYIPHMYLCVAFAAYLLMEQWNKDMLYRVLNIIFCIFIIANMLPWGMQALRRINQGAYTTAVLQGMAQNSERENAVYEIGFVQDAFIGMNYNLKDFNIDYEYKNISEIESIDGTTYSNWLYYKRKQ